MPRIHGRGTKPSLYYFVSELCPCDIRPGMARFVAYAGREDRVHGCAQKSCMGPPTTGVRGRLPRPRGKPRWPSTGRRRRGTGLPTCASPPHIAASRKNTHDIRDKKHTNKTQIHAPKKQKYVENEHSDVLWRRNLWGARGRSFRCLLTEARYVSF